MNLDSSTSPKKGRWKRPIFLLVAVVIAVGIWMRSVPDLDVEEAIVEGQSALEARQPEVALSWAQRVLEKHPEHAEALLLSSEANTAMEEYQFALASCERIPDSAGSIAMRARVLSGDIERKVFRRLDASENQYRRALEIDPDNEPVHDRLTQVLGLQTRTDELVPHVISLIEGEVARLDHLMMLSAEHRLAPESAVLSSFAQSSNEDSAGVRLAMARRASLSEDVEQAIVLLRDIVKQKPAWALAQARLGQLLIAHRSDEEWEAWQEQLPHEVDHALIWQSRGIWYQKHGQLEVAVRCYAESLKRDPNLVTANYQLGHTLVTLGDQKAAGPFLQRAKFLQEYDRLLDVRKVAQQGMMSGVPYRKVTELAESLGLIWEAYGWAQIAAETETLAEWSATTTTRLRPQIDQLPHRRCIHEFPSEHQLDYSIYPLPESFIFPSGEPEAVGPQASNVTVRFQEVAAALGIEFSYFNSASPTVRGLGRVYEFTGGGVAILDYDKDGWSDLYLTQGCRWPAGSGNDEHLDQLFRNRRGLQFEHVTSNAGIVEEKYSQGVTVGDFNSDGFPDLYIANIGGNRFFMNQGDGTFNDVTQSAGIEGAHWTTSCLMADLNADGLPDIYDVNYLSGEELFERPCRNPDGTRNSCAPQDFEGDLDQCYLNLGNGCFQNISQQAGIALPSGKGLGIVSWLPSDSRGMNLFIANDGVPNFCFVNQSESAGQTPHFEEQALVRGLALNQRGVSEACMGIATGDLDGDRLLDFFVTNFMDESNSLYRQSSGQLFQDETVRFDLRKSSLKLLGFGTQALDGNLDGFLDLAVANGHIDDFSDRGLLYEMPPQFFLNTGEMRFQEQTAQQTGPYFAQHLLGRGMAKCDFNRDGLVDLVISHLDAPVALLKNDSSHQHHYFALSLSGTSGSRDAIGTRVSLETPERIITRELTAGDGYQASNERRLVFGLGEQSTIISLTIEWPSGHTQVVHKPDVDREMLAIENRWSGYLPPPREKP